MSTHTTEPVPAPSAPSVEVHAPPRPARRRLGWGAIAAIIGGGVLLLGLVFGGGVAVGATVFGPASLAGPAGLPEDGRFGPGQGGPFPDRGAPEDRFDQGDRGSSGSHSDS